MKTSAAQRELSTRSAFTSLLMKPEMLSLSNTFGLLGRILRDRDREHRVGYGESRSFFSENYCKTMKALKKLNNIKDDVIYTGRFVAHDSDMCSAGFQIRLGMYCEEWLEIYCVVAAVCHGSF
jgi:hypothetical protein